VLVQEMADSYNTVINTPLSWPLFRGPFTYKVNMFIQTSVSDPNPDQDPHVFGSISQRFGSGSGSFYHPSINKEK
jgi:hypothetical protein